MVLTYSEAALDGTGIEPATVDTRAAQACAARADIASAGFVRALDESPSTPPPTDAERVVVLGIGGSALGARAVHEACGGADNRALVVVDNVDPEALERAWGGGDPARTDWVVVSKSGGTTETLAQYAVVRERLTARGGLERVHVVTGPDGPLREWAERDGVATYPVPVPVGGRFSVFTAAATVPLALAGHDTDALLDGARGAARHAAEDGNLAARLAALLVAAAEAGRHVVTMWSYAERLETVGEWFRQLWAESLGKVRADGVRVGQTPVHCVGSTDQHSIQQLMVEGPRDKAVLVLAGPPTAETRAPEGAPGAAAGRRLADVLDAMRRATTAGMVRAGCPAATLRLESWDERSMGALLMLFLCATVYGGALLEVDPYGQPGVEAAKDATRRLLAEPGGPVDRDTAGLLGEGGATRLVF